MFYYYYLTYVMERKEKVNLRDWENDEGIEPEALEGADVMGGDGTCVPHEFAAANHHALPGHVGEPELQPHVPQVEHIHARTDSGDDGGQPAVHVEAGRAASPDGEGVEVEGIDREGDATCEEESAIPCLDPLGPRVENAPESTRGGIGLCGAKLDGDEGGAGGGLPLAAAGGVERGNAGLSTGVAFDGGVVGIRLWRHEGELDPTAAIK